MSAAQVGGWVPDVDDVGPSSMSSPSAPSAPSPASPPPSTSLASRPAGDRVVVVAAGGGVGRSTTADLVARRLCAAGSLVLIDDAPGLVSPRRTLSRDSGGLAAAAGYGGSYQVLAPDSPSSRVDAVAAVEAMGTG